MPVRALWGIGPVTEKRLLALGVTTVGELAAVAPDALERYLGVAAGRHLSELSRGIDDRPVEPEQEAKSVGHEETFATDLWDREDLHRRLHRMVDASATALRQAGRAARTVTVKLRFGDFTQITRSHTLDGPVAATPAIAAVADALLEGVDLAKGVRLLGVSLSGLAEPGAGTQLRLDFDSPEASDDELPAEGSTTRGSDAARTAERLEQTWGSMTEAVDAIRARYGGEAVGPASLVTPDGLRPKRRGEAQWGPTRGTEGGPAEGRSGGPADGAAAGTPGGSPGRSDRALENRGERADNL